jgi:homocitrate synthase NifV
MKTPLSQPVVFVDSTLRDGAQAPGIILTYAHRAEIAKLLAGMGISDIEAGIPAMGSREIKFLSEMNRMYPAQRIIAWCRAIEADLHDAQHANCKNVHIAFPVSDIQLAAMGKDRQWLFGTLERLVDSAKKKFDFVSVGAMDATRADIGIVKYFCKLAASGGVNRVRIADTLGVLTPHKTMLLFDTLAQSIDVGQLEFHGHNDLGMATANALCAAEAGAGALSVTVNGIGERAGNTAMEEIVMALHIHKITMQQLKISSIQKVCERVSYLTKRKIPFCKPVTGKGVFLHESGVHWKALLNDKQSFEPFSPALTGHEQSMPVAGSHSGGATVRALMLRKGLQISDAASKKVAGIIRRKVQKIGRVMTEAEVAKLCTTYKTLI